MNSFLSINVKEHNNDKNMDINGIKKDVNVKENKFQKFN